MEKEVSAVGKKNLDDHRETREAQREDQEDAVPVQEEDGTRECRSKGRNSSTVGTRSEIGRTKNKCNQV